MRAVLLEAPNTRLRLVDDHPEPEADGGEVIDVVACGVCRSDLRIVDGEAPSPMPLVLGHEVTGVHPRLGPVIVYAPWGCGRCEHCTGGLEMICAEVREAGVFADGGYAQRMRVPGAAYLAPLGDLDPVVSAPLACAGLTAYRAVTQGLDVLRRRGRRRRALIIGAGGLGQYAIRYLRLLTDAEVAVLDRSAAKRAAALDRGAHGAFGPADDLPQFDFVVDFVGSETTLNAATRAVARLGLVAVVGLDGGRVPFGFGAVPHEARFTSSVWGSRAQLDELLGLAGRESSVLNPVETLPLEDAQTAHDRLRAGEIEGRVVLTVERPGPVRHPHLVASGSAPTGLR
ncbi:MAG: alcohol dehydrogenase catalytic domain-containing protein [Acidimicrobiaceae bacterium]|nr:alcohol dehydrogenase catalytic domain-containing protein [Acidimicrobiaceae bacterium]